MRQHARRNKERAKLSAQEIALLELLRAPVVYVEAGWGTLVEQVRAALAKKEVREDVLRAAVAGERNTAVRESFAKLTTDLASR